MIFIRVFYLGILRQAAQHLFTDKQTANSNLCIRKKEITLAISCSGCEEASVFSPRSPYSRNKWHAFWELWHVNAFSHFPSHFSSDLTKLFKLGWKQRLMQAMRSRRRSQSTSTVTHRWSEIIQKSIIIKILHHEVYLMLSAGPHGICVHKTKQKTQQIYI